MATKVICDRCGIEPDHAASKVTLDRYSLGKKERLDLCKACFDAVVEKTMDAPIIHSQHARRKPE